MQALERGRDEIEACAERGRPAFLRRLGGVRGGCGRFRLRRSEEGFERGELLLVRRIRGTGARVHVRVELLGAFAGLDRLGDDVLLPFFDVRAHEDARIADVFAGRVVALDEPFEDAQVALDLLLLRMSDEVPDVRLALLSVPVDAPVALLELQQRPGDVEVDQLVREVVEVEPLGREVRGQEDADRLLFDAEVGDDLLDLDVRACSRPVQRPCLLLGEAEVFAQPGGQPVDGRDTLGEDDDAVVLPARLPFEVVPEQLEELPVLRERLLVDRLRERQERRQRLDVRPGRLVVVFPQGVDPMLARSR